MDAVVMPPKRKVAPPVEESKGKEQVDKVNHEVEEPTITTSEVKKRRRKEIREKSADDETEEEAIVAMRDIDEEDEERNGEEGLISNQKHKKMKIEVKSEPSSSFPRLTTQSTVKKSMKRRSSPHRTRGFTAAVSAGREKKERQDEDEEESRGESCRIEENVCCECGGAFPSKAEMIEHQKANHRELASNLPRLTGTLLCAHPHCGVSMPDMKHLIAHLAGFHNQTQYRIRQQNFTSMETFETWKATIEANSKSNFISRSQEVEVSPGVTELEMYCECSDEWRSCDKDSQERPLVACPAHMSVKLDRVNDKVSVIGCLAHLGHLKKAHWTMFVNDGDQNKRPQLIKTKCSACGQWFRSRTALSNHRKVDHPDCVRVPALMCGDSQCNEVCDTMLSLCEHVADAHKREDLVVEEYRFNSMNDFELWKEKMEADTMSFFTKVSGKQRASTSGPNADCYFRYYQCHLSGYVVRPSIRRSHPNFDLNRIKMRNRGTKKMGRYCTAFMNIKINENDGSVLLKGCLGHFGHDCDIRRVPVPVNVRAEIVELLQKGITEDDVMNIIKGKAGPHERAYYLQKYEVKNIVKKLIKESQGSMYYKYDDDPGELDLVEEEALWQTIKRPFVGTMYRPSSGAHPKRRGIGTFAMQFTPNLGRRRRLVYRPGMNMRDIEVDESLDVGAVEEYYEGGQMEDVNAQDDPQTYMHQAEMEARAGVAAAAVSVTAPSNPLRKLARMPLLKDSSASMNGNREFELTIQSIQEKIRLMSDELKRTKDQCLAETLLEEVRQLESRMSRLIPQTTVSRGFLKREEGYYDDVDEMDGDTMYYEEDDDPPHRAGPSSLSRRFTMQQVYAVSSPGVHVDVEDLEELEDGDVIHTIEV